MRPLSPAAAALVADIARNYGLTTLAPDGDGLLRIDIEGQDILIAFSDAWQSVVLTAVLAWDAALPGQGPYRAFALRDRFQGPTTRLARAPDSGALVLVAELGLKGLHYAAFAIAMQTFLSDARRAMKDLSLPPIDG